MPPTPEAVVIARCAALAELILRDASRRQARQPLEAAISAGREYQTRQIMLLSMMIRGFSSINAVTFGAIVMPPLKRRWRVR